jgi:ATP-dependent Clp protease ATP-binding subunit ClpA
MFERFTSGARHVVVGAQAHAREFRHQYIGTEHILLALLEVDADGPAGRALGESGVRPATVRAEILRRIGPGALGETDAEALRAIGIDLDAVRAKVEESFGPGALDRASEACRKPAGRGLVGRLRGRGPTPQVGHIPVTPRSKKVLELSLRESVRLHSGEIGSAHILLGLLREGEGLAVQILAETGVDLDDLRRRTVAAISKAA